MNEDEARQVVLVQALESPGRPASALPTWTDDDRRWATRQALATVGESATPERFVVARAVLALQRLLPRDGTAQRWLQRRAWHPAWTLLALVGGLVAGLLVDQLGPPQRVNLLAPAVWAVVAWNVVVYLALLLPTPVGGLRGLRALLARWWQPAADGLGSHWAEQAAPLTLRRVALVLHTAAAALALGLITGLYLRGLVLDYRAGWQSTFLDAPTVQLWLDALLAPARALTGIAVPDVAPLQVAPGADATASAAPWIHLFAATLALLVVLPRALLAWLSAWRAAQLSRQFPIALDTPYFEALHPLMRPGLSNTLRLLWLAPQGTALRLFDTPIDGLAAPLTVLRSEEGDELQLQPLPPDLAEWAASSALATSAGPMHPGAPDAPASSPQRRWWQALWAPADARSTAVVRLRQQTDAVLLVQRPGMPPPPWLAELQRPLVVLVDAPAAAAAAGVYSNHSAVGSATDEAADPATPVLPLHSRDEGWLAEGRLLRALHQALPDDPRLQRLRQAWGQRQQARLDAGVALVADSLARIAAAHAPVVDEGFLQRRAVADTARQALAAALDVELQRFEDRLAELAGGPVARGTEAAADDSGVIEQTGRQAGADAEADATAPTATGQALTTAPAHAVAPARAPASHPAASTASSLRSRFGEGRAALVGGALTGALAGLKADVLSGGLTMGAGALAGGVIGALGAAGVARGLNVVRGTDKPFVAWSDDALAPIVQGLLESYLAAAHPRPTAPQQQHAALAAALAQQQAALAALWRARERRLDNSGEAERLATALQPILARTVRQTLGGP